MYSATNAISIRPMRAIFLAFAISLPISATTLALDSLVGTQTLPTVILDANAATISKPIKFCDVNQPSICRGPYYLSITSGDRVVVNVSLMNVPSTALRNPSPTGCGDPCEIDARLNFGDAVATLQEVTAGGTNVSPANIRTITIPTVPDPVATSVVFPLEMLGMDNLRRAYQVTIPAGAPTTACSIIERVNNLSYQVMAAGFFTGGAQRPWDGKQSFRINNGAWINVTATNAQSIDPFGFYGPDLAHGITGITNTIELKIPIADNSFSANSLATIENRFNGSDSIGSGYRILVQFISCGSDIQGSQIVTTSNVSVFTATGGTIGSIVNGSDVYLYNAPRIHGRYNGARHVTAVTTGTFTLAPCGAGAGYYLLTCTSPDETATVPTSTANAALLTQFPNTSQPAMFAAYIVAPAISAITYYDPNAETAPAGGVPANGLTFVTTRNSLLNSNAAGLGYKLGASCADCHAGNPNLTSGMSQPLSDLYYFNYSNRAIEVRTLFHNGTWQNSIDVAAMVRGINTINKYSNARPWNPPYQPGSGLDSNPADQWAAGAGVDSYCTYDNDIKEYLVPSGSFALWANNSILNYREICMPWLLLDWNHWLPAVHPVDGLIPTFFSGPDVAESSYLTAVTDLAPMTNAAYQAHYLDLNTLHDNTKQSGEIATRAGVCSVPNNNYGDCYPPSQGTVMRASGSNWGSVKFFELMHPILEAKADILYTQIYGARPSGNYQTRGWPPNREWFDTGNHINVGFSQNSGAANNFVFPVPQSWMGTAGAPVVPGQTTASFYDQTNKWYVGAFVTNNGNFHKLPQTFLDDNYVWDFLHVMGSMRPCAWYCFAMPEILFNQASQDLSAPSTNGITGGTQPNMIWHVDMLGNAAAPGWAFLPTADQTSMLSQIIQMWTTQLNAFTTAQWNAATQFNLYSSGFSTSQGPIGTFSEGGIGAGEKISAILAYGKHFGVSDTTLAALRTVADTLTFDGSGWKFESDEYANCAFGTFSGGFAAASGWWPGCSDMGSSYVWTNQTTLGANITTTNGTTVTLANCAPIPNLSEFKIDSEVFAAISGFGGAGSCTGTVLRGLNLTTAATHTSGANVSN